MFNAKHIKYIVMLFFIMGTQAIVFSASSVRVAPFHAADSPVEISQIQYVTASNEYYLTISNNSEWDIKEIVLKGIVFDVNEAVAGGFLRGCDVELKAKETKSHSFNFEEYTNVQDKTMLETLKNSIQNNNVVILIPYKVIFKSIPEKERGKEKNRYWTLDYKLIKDLKPGNMSSFQKVQGKIIRKEEAWEPDLPCYFCEWCQEEAYTCGLAMIASNCRPYACTVSWYCSCLYWQCNYICKDVDQCC
ncbi:MAG: hypothetical protein A2Y62_02650 [Candidatus Fischerbacteria bacterium RBG_13_37_8]|uniref:Uncharacterized protein n=1 Tax=Candidatus Fischerbacteria bacterium RBG_13_37_8 TaxID=1817863 RepID=A0A1F5VSB0_9BACT|nr:MAG: hypothetical protein A2Y62_02650 [Candidatus Fischerbacteria bacterium RBG_13_37_8]